ncbi:MAG: ATP-binding protein, partial [Fulvivirga sp.]|nr:ATP-binding protein [Fulvivirga sp.]
KTFSRLSARPTGGESSTGLGLALVKRYVKLVGGEVWYEDNSGVGATFVVELPIAQQHA